jgi:hypothetical protein
VIFELAGRFEIARAATGTLLRVGVVFNEIGVGWWFRGFASAGYREAPHPSYATTRRESHPAKGPKSYTPVEDVAID